MTGAWIALGLVPWFAMAGYGGWLTVSGHRLWAGFPVGVSEGWPARLLGIVYLAFALFLCSVIVRDSSPRPDTMLAPYVALAATLWITIDRNRKTRVTGK
jgi:hypothetical protein